MSAERKHIPDWARREREADLKWINENAENFWVAIEAQGNQRGVILVDTTSRPIGEGHPFGFLTEEMIGQLKDQDINRMVQNYDPQRELVIVLLKSGERTSTYRLLVRNKPFPR